MPFHETILDNWFFLDCLAEKQNRLFYVLQKLKNTKSSLGFFHKILKNNKFFGPSNILGDSGSHVCGEQEKVWWSNLKSQNKVSQCLLPYTFLTRTIPHTWSWDRRQMGPPRVKQLEIHSLLMETPRQEQREIKGGSWTLQRTHISHSRVRRPSQPQMCRKGSLETKLESSQGMFYPEVFSVGSILAKICMHTQE